MKAIIMAGGEGTRLRPLTCLLPKPLTPVAGTPAVQHSILLLKKHGITEIALTLQYLSGLITSRFGSGEEMGVSLQYYVENQPLGTAGSVKNTGDFTDSPFVVMSGDAVTDLDLSAAIAYHQEKKAAVTIVLKQVDTPLEYGVVVTDREGKVVRFLEKPTWSEVCSDTVNTGIYIIEPEAMRYVEKGEVTDFSKDLFPKLMEKGIPIYGYVMQDYWCDVGDIQAYRTCQQDVLNGRVKLPLEARQVKEGVWIGKDTVLEEDVELETPVFIGAGCHIGTGSVIGPNTVIGNGCTIERQVRVRESTLWEYSHLMAGAQVEGAVICDRVSVHSDSKISSGVVVGSNTIIMSGAVLNDAVKVWNDKVIEAGSMVLEDLITGHGSGNRITFDEKVVIGNVEREMRPETLMKLGAIFATLCGRGSKIAVSSNGSAATMMGKYAVITGVMLTGCGCVDFGQQPVPITRSGVKFYSLTGGIHISSDDKSGKIEVEFISSSGASISRAMERKLENLYARGEYMRAPEERLKEVVSMQSYKFYYLRDIINQCRNGKLPFRLLLNVKNPLIQGLLKSILDDVGCKYKLDAQEMQKTRFSDEVQSGGFDLGVYIDGTGEKLTLFDGQGQMVGEDMMSCLSALILFKSKPSAAYVARVSAPSVIEVLADKFGGSVLRTKASPIDVMAKLAGEGREFAISPQFVIEFDAIGGLIKILDFMRSNKTTLRALLEEIPDFYIRSNETPCQPKEKGLLIKTMAAQSQGKKIEFTDGIKIYEQGGWILVLPHSGKDACRVVCEGYTEEFAQELMGEYQHRIEEILNQQKDEKNP